MNRVLAILLLSVFLYNIAGYNIWFAIADLENKFEINRTLEHTNSLLRLRVKKSEISKIVFSENRKEFSYSDEFYDVKSIAYEGDELVINCVPDRKEKELLRVMSLHVEHTIAPNAPGKKEKNHLKEIIKDYFIPQYSALFYPGKETTLLHFYKQPDYSPSLFLFAPPPELFVS